MVHMACLETRAQLRNYNDVSSCRYESKRRDYKETAEKILNYIVYVNYGFPTVLIQHESYTWIVPTVAVQSERRLAQKVPGVSALFLEQFYRTGMKKIER
jgi:hypothetical protein